MPPNEVFVHGSRHSQKPPVGLLWNSVASFLIPRSEVQLREILLLRYCSGEQRQRLHKLQMTDSFLKHQSSRIILWIQIRRLLWHNKGGRWELFVDTIFEHLERWSTPSSARALCSAPIVRSQTTVAFGANDSTLEAAQISHPVLSLDEVTRAIFVAVISVNDIIVRIQRGDARYPAAYSRRRYENSCLPGS
jgi:hypothetical protein